MKKILFAVAALVFLAASCNSQPYQATPSPSPQTQQSPTTKLDSAVNELTESIESEEDLSMQTDEDLTTSDEDIINDLEGVSNESY